MFEIFGWKKLASQRKIAKDIMVCKSVNGFALDSLSEMFVDSSNRTSYTLRDTIVAN